MLLTVLNWYIHYTYVHISQNARITCTRAGNFIFTYTCAGNFHACMRACKCLCRFTASLRGKSKFSFCFFDLNTFVLHQSINQLCRKTILAKHNTEMQIQYIQQSGSFFEKFFSKYLCFIISRDFYPKIMNFPENHPMADFDILAALHTFLFIYFFGLIYGEKYCDFFNLFFWIHFIVLGVFAIFSPCSIFYYYQYAKLNFFGDF